jgi:hypothetical protein
MHKARAILGLGLLLAVGMTRTVAASTWQVDQYGNCSRVWEPSDMARGPKAIINTPLEPFRALAGGCQMIPEFWKAAAVPSGVITVPTMILFSTAMGAIEAPIWAIGGIFDTLTGGYFEIAPDRATDLSVMPIVPLFMPVTPEVRTTDRCGRPLSK